MTGQESTGQLFAAGGPPGGMYPGGGMPPGGMPPGGMPPGGMPPGGMPPGMPPGGAMVPPTMGGGMGPVAAQPPGVPSAGAPKKSSVGLIIGLVLGVLVLGGAGAAAYFLLLAAPKPVLVKFVPKDVQVYFEVPSLPKALIAFSGMDPIDDKELDAEKTLDDWVDGVATAFDVEEEVARDTLTSVDGYAFALRSVQKDAQGAMLVKFRSAGGVEKLLESKRFDEEGDVKGGKRYELDAKEVDDLAKLEKMSAPEKAFSFLSVSGEEDILVWFASENLLVFGDERFVKDIGAVLEGKDSLETSETWQQAKFEDGATAMGFVDAGLIGDFDPDVRKGYFNDVTPFVGSLRMVDAGMMVTLAGQLAGNKMPDSKSFSAPAKLDLMNKLPKETIAYIAYSSKSELDGKEAEKLLIKQVKETDKDAADKLEEGLKELSKEFGVSLATLYDAIGDQGVIAVLASSKLKLAPGIKPEDALKHGGVAFIQHVGDKDAAEKLVEKLRKEVFEKLGEEAFETKKEGKGFVAKPTEKDEVPTIIVKFVDDHLVVAVGEKKTAEGIVDAFEGKGDTLDGDAAHKKALAAFAGEPHAILWVDTGRITKDMLDEAKDLRKEMAKEGVPVDALILEGDDRMTSALAIRVALDGDKWNYQVDSLNTLAAAPIGALVSGAALAGALSGGGDLGGGGDFGGGDNEFKPGDFDTAAKGGDDTGVPECNAVVNAMIACAKRKGRTEQVETANKIRDGYKAMGKFSPDEAKKTCQEQIDTMKKFGCF